MSMPFIKFSCKQFHHLRGQLRADSGFLVLEVRVKGFASRG
jgi:hypothetical protein